MFGKHVLQKLKYINEDRCFCLGELKKNILLISLKIDVIVWSNKQSKKERNKETKHDCPCKDIFTKWIQVNRATFLWNAINGISALIYPNPPTNAQIKHVNHTYTCELYAFCFPSLTNILPLQSLLKRERERERVERPKVREKKRAILLNRGK